VIKKNNKPPLDEGDICQLEDEYRKLVSSLPTRSPIFLPTEKLDITERLSGVKIVKEIYDHRLDSVYRPRLKALRDKYKDAERCFIIGNGPSLRKTDLSVLKDEITFAVNGFFLMARELDWHPTFYVVEDHLVAEDRRHWIDEFKGPTKLFPVYLAYCLSEDDDTIFFNHRPRKSYPHGFDFSTDAREITYTGCTVTYTCMQLAFYFGFKEIYLIGVDASYQLPKDTERSSKYGVGILDMQSDDPNHFHPDYFGKGFRWHDPQVDKMIEAYQEARKVTENSAQRIYNATIGGMLEVFERRSFYTLFPNAHRLDQDLINLNDRTSFPRLLVFDVTAKGDGTATGEIKGNLFVNWPDGRYLQVFHKGRDRVGLVRGTDTSETLVAEGPLQAILHDFSPEIILYRPVPGTHLLHRIAMSTIRQYGVPLVTWIMDDWPKRLENEDPNYFKDLDNDLRWLLKRAALRLSICDAMSDAFERRYGVPFFAIANGVDPQNWPAPTLRTKGTFKLRYAGSLSEDMTLSSVRLIAEAVEQVAKAGVDIAFEIKTRPYWHARAAHHFGNLEHTSFVLENFSGHEYAAWLSSADAVVIAYNFDGASKNYIRYSMANKLPECLASGVPLLAVGPQDIATLRYLDEIDCGVRIFEPSVSAIAQEIVKLAESPARRLELAQHAQRVAFERHDVRVIREKLRRLLSNAASQSSDETTEFSLSQSVAVDETEVIAHLMRDQRGKENIMLDVGAHVGTSAAPFARLGWRIICFEPDPNNRAKLVERFAHSSFVTIDPRAVADRAESERSFYASEESTGISGMLKFRETHEEIAKVEVTTVAEILKSYQVSHIDFLKIDVEGYDFAVLKGVPWDDVRPAIIECEFEDAKTKLLGHDVNEICEFLVAKGYAVYLSEWYPIVRYGVRHDWRRLIRYSQRKPAPDAWGNILAFRDDPGFGTLAAAFQRFTKRRAPAEGVASPKPDRATASVTPAPAGATPAPAEAPPAPAAAAARSIEGKKSPASEAKSPVSDIRSLMAVLPMSSLYTRIAVGIERNLPALVPVGRFVMHGVRTAHHRALDGYTVATTAIWHHAPFLASVSHFIESTLRAASRYPLASGGAMLAVLGLSFAAMLFEPARALLMSAVGALVGMVGGAAIAAYAMRHGRQRQDALEAEIRSWSGEVAANSDRTDRALTEIAVGMERVNRAFEDVSSLRSALEDSMLKLTELTTSMERTPLRNIARYQTFNRQLSDGMIDRLVAWSKKLGLNMNARAVAYLASRLGVLEARMHGRLATTIEDILLRCLVVKAAAGSPRSVLEIGTLFGIAAAALHEAVLFDPRGIKLTLLDPLDGYYGKDHADIITGQPVNIDILRANLKLAGIDEANVTLIKQFSHEPSAIEMAGRNRYDALIIDGDHSFDGIKLDFEEYSRFVKVGGYIVVDDYKSPEWPGVTEYVDKFALSRPGVEFLGAEWRTAVFRVLEPQH
jgi:FkbM family methyltransferase